MNTKNIIAIDIGTGLIKIIVARKNVNSSEFEVLSKLAYPSYGMRKGVVANPEEVGKIIITALKECEMQINKKIEGVYVNINGSHIFSMNSRGLVSVSRADQKISSEDIERVIQGAKAFSLPNNKEILEVFPKEFIIDGVGGIKDPLDMQGVRFESEVLIVGGFTPYIKNVQQSILNADVQVNDIILGQLAAVKSVIEPREKELGVALIDIGAGTTSMSVFEEGALIHTTVFPVGSNDITNDIAIGLKTDIDTAEKIKIEFGECFFSKGTKKKEKIISENGESVEFTNAILRKIIGARVLEIFGFIKDELKKISKLDKLPAGIVFVGGGSKMPGIVELAKKELKLPSKLGTLQGFNPIIEDSSWAVACGLILIGGELEEDGSFGIWTNFTRRIKKIIKFLTP